jgi:AraC-like DNA-binding protein
MPLSFRREASCAGRAKPVYCTNVRLHETSERDDWARPAVPLIGGVSLLTARFSRHHYARHSHDAYVLAVIDQGAQQFTYRQQPCVAAAGDVVILAPGEAHDGRPYRDGAYLYRTLHIEPQLLANDRGVLPDFPAAVLQDPALGRRLAGLCSILDGSEWTMEEARERFDAVIDALRSRHGGLSQAIRSSPPAERALAEAAQRLLATMDCAERATVEEVGRRLGVTRSHLSRAYTRTYGLPPHAWLLQRRLGHALTLMQQGVPLAEVAVGAGFVDQSHFTRRFKAVHGITPAQAAATLAAARS